MLHILLLMLPMLYILRVATGVNISTHLSIYRLGLKLVDNFVDNINTLNQLKYINSWVYFYQSISIFVASFVVKQC